jgi:parallel beta-helix repeat protein
MVISRSLLPMLLGVCACLGSANPAGAVVRYVDSRAAPGGDGLSWATAYDSLSTALTAAQPGDQIWVAAGRYVGNFTLKSGVEVYGGFAGTETELTQRNWTANPTILDGNQTGSVVAAPSDADATTRIDGFTITNGSGTLHTWYTCGGGLHLDSSSPTIANNTITGNRADECGGLYLDDSCPTIVSNTITGNRADEGGGGGLCLFDSFPMIANNTIAGNSAAWGGGLFLCSSSPTIAHNTITDNWAYYGGGLYLYSSSPTIVNNTIAGNSADEDGGGLYLSNSYPTIANTIVAFNSSGIYLDLESGRTPALRYNCVHGNTWYNYAGLADPTGTDGNISADPLLVRNPDDGGDGWGDDPATPDVDEGANDDFGDLQLLSGSPCIDAGDNAAVPADTPDLDGDGDTTEPLPFDLSGWSRFVDDPLTADTGSGTPPIVDMGAYEYRVEILGDCDPNGRLDLADFATVPDCLAGPGSTVPAECDCADMDSDNDVDLADFAEFQTRLSDL